MRRMNLKALSLDGFESFAQELGWPKYRAHQLLDWIYRKKAVRFDAMTNLPKRDRDLLEERAFIGDLEPVRRQQSSDGTQKFLFRLSDGQEIESVLIPEEDRRTLCISTQVGCTLDCAFCLTGTMGLLRNLKAHEIVDQVLWIQRDLEQQPDGSSGAHSRAPLLNNIVLMGMGEPLANDREVTEALRRLTHPKMVGFSPRRITVSTSGLAPQIRKLGESGLNVNLAVSLNATTNAVRDRLMPAVNQLYPLEVLLEACRAYPIPPRRRLFIEYVLLKGVNDAEADARRLIPLLKGIRCKVNLIPFNEFSGSPFRRPDDETVLRFQEILLNAHLTTFIRKSRGRDILAACGQLRTESSTRPSPALENVPS